VYIYVTGAQDFKVLLTVGAQGGVQHRVFGIGSIDPIRGPKATQAGGIPYRNVGNHFYYVFKLASTSCKGLVISAGISQGKGLARRNSFANFKISVCPERNPLEIRSEHDPILVEVANRDVVTNCLISPADCDVVVLNGR